jgi:hypothetical protein
LRAVLTVRLSHAPSRANIGRSAARGRRAFRDSVAHPHPGPLRHPSRRIFLDRFEAELGERRERSPRQTAPAAWSGAGGTDEFMLLRAETQPAV